MRIDEKIKILEKWTRVMRFFLVIFSVILLVTPYFPKIKYTFSSFETQLDPKENLPIVLIEAKIKGENFLYIEKSKVNRKIIETNSIRKVHENVWVWPSSSRPDLGGNTVLLAHRYANIGGERASTFYNLPDMSKGDKSFVLWNGKIYEYEVFETFVVDPDKIEILENTNEDILTMFTCTPLWTSKQRFVVRSKLIKVWE